MCSEDYGANVSLEKLSHKLREVYVTELLGDRHVQYEAFVAHIDLDYEEESKKFKGTIQQSTHTLTISVIFI